MPNRILSLTLQAAKALAFAKAAIKKLNSYNML